MLGPLPTFGGELVEVNVFRQKFDDLLDVVRQTKLKKEKQRTTREPWRYKEKQDAVKHSKRHKERDKRWRHT